MSFLKDWGFTSTNDRAFIPLLKALGFLSSDRQTNSSLCRLPRPYSFEADYGGHSAGDLRDIFLIKEHPTAADEAIEGKFKSFHNASDHVAGLLTKTFFGLLNLAVFLRKLRVPRLIRKSKRRPQLWVRKRPRNRLNMEFQVCTTTYRYIFPQRRMSKYITRSSSH